MSFLACSFTAQLCSFLHLRVPKYVVLGNLLVNSNFNRRGVYLVSIPGGHPWGIFECILKVALCDILAGYP